MASISSVDLGADGAGEARSGQVIHEHVYETLREALIAGQLAPGRALSVRRLAAEFSVSAMPAREAIRRLVAMGALELTPTRRVMIANMTEEKLNEIRMARLSLEPEISALALRSVMGKSRQINKLVRDLEKIDALLDAAILDGDVVAYSRHNRDFHFALYRASNSSVLLGLVESLWLQFGPHMRQIIGRLGTSCLSDDQHKDVVAAIKDGDEAALRVAIHADIEHGMSTITLYERNHASL